MARDRIDSHPLRTAASRQAPLALGGGLLSGPGYLGALTAAGIPIGRWDVLIAVGLSLLAAVPGLLALRRTVRDAEPDLTPWRDARDDQGQPLRTCDRQVLDQLLDHRLEQLGYPVQPRPPAAAPADPPGPTGTSAWPAAPRAGRPSAEPPPYRAAGRIGRDWAGGDRPGGDWVGDRVRVLDEDLAAQRAGPPGCRAGTDRAVPPDADVRPGRHQQAGGRRG